MSDALAGLLMQEQARSVRLEAERNRWAELAGEKEGEITTLRERLAEAERLLRQSLDGLDDDDPTPWCNCCGARTQVKCKCGPIAENE
jgi:hypothetical protein